MRRYTKTLKVAIILSVIIILVLLLKKKELPQVSSRKRVEKETLENSADGTVTENTNALNEIIIAKICKNEADMDISKNIKAIAPQSEDITPSIEPTPIPANTQNSTTFLLSKDRSENRTQSDPVEEGKYINVDKIEDPFSIGCHEGLIKQNDSDAINILLWPGRKNWHRLEDYGDICHIENGNTCRILTDPDLLSKSDVILVDAFKPFTSPVDIFKVRTPRQKLIYHQYEAPYISWKVLRYSLPDLPHAFNATSTFTFDSDVPFWEEKEMTLHIDEKLREKHKSAGINYAANKTQLVAWFVSNCKPQSQRGRYAEALKQYVPVDIMGRCGNLTYGCGSKMRYQDCDSTFLSIKYKFYLSFENNICKDYVTEKLWRIIANKKSNIIPIVLGGANYSRLLPPKTYIDVGDFASPEELSKYLLTIDGNDNLYNEYIRNKMSIISKAVPFMWASKSSSYVSRLCRYVHEKRGEITRTGVDGDVREYWKQDKICKTLSEAVPGFDDGNTTSTLESPHE